MQSFMLVPVDYLASCNLKILTVLKGKGFRRYLRTIYEPSEYWPKALYDDKAFGKEELVTRSLHFDI